MITKYDMRLSVIAVSSWKRERGCVDGRSMERNNRLETEYVPMGNNTRAWCAVCAPCLLRKYNHSCRRRPLSCTHSLVSLS